MAMAQSDRPTDGLNVFVVEDEALVALNLEDMLLELGCTVIGPAMRLDRAHRIVDDGLAADAAILDVNIAGEMVHGLARRLAEQGLPIVFATGYGLAGLGPEFHDYPVLQKPYTSEEVAHGLARAIKSRRQLDLA